MADHRDVFKRPDVAALLRAVMLFIIGFLPSVWFGAPGALIVLAIGWPLAATAYTTDGLPSLALLFGGAAGIAVIVPSELSWLPLIWAAAGSSGILLPEKDPIRRGIRWGVLAACVVCAALGALAMRYPGETASGISQEFIDWIASVEYRDSILVSAYQHGLASIDESLLAAQTQQTGEYADYYGAYYSMLQAQTIVLSDEAAQELLYSLRTTLEVLFRAGMPHLIVSFMGLTVTLCTVMPDEWLRRRGENEHPLPQIEEWKLPPRMAIAAAVMLLMSVVPYLIGSSVTSYAVTLCVGAGSWAFMVQGAGLLAHFLKKRSIRRNTRYSLALVLAVLLPMALEIMGIVDQITSLRKRGDTE